MTNKGFTLIELLAVIVILGIVVAIAIPGINSVISNSRKKALDAEAGIIQSAAIRKTVGDPNYDFSYINKNNLAQHLETNGAKFDYIGINNNDGKVTVTLTKDGYSTVASNDNEINNAKVYGLRINFANPSNPYTRLDDSVELCKNTTPCAAVGTDTLNPVNKFDEADIYKDIVDVVEDDNHFVKIPKFYIKKTVDGDIEEIRITKKPTEGYYLPNVFKNHETGTELNYVLIGKYSASLSNGKLESKSGKIPKVLITLPNFRNYAKANGIKYQLMDIHAIDVIQTLFSIEFGTLNSQSVMYGYSKNISETVITGQTDNVLSSSGSKSNNSSGTELMMYRGIESIYGNVFQAIDGINIKNGIAYVSTNPTNYISDKFDGDYIAVGYTNSLSENYTKRLGFDPKCPYVNLPIEVDIFENSIIKEYNTYANGNRVVFFGGSWAYNNHNGMNYWHLSRSSTYTANGLGARIIKTG